MFYRIVYQNIVFALVIKFACLALGAVGIANMWFAIFADVGSYGSGGVAECDPGAAGEKFVI